jgi:DNA-binding beta-propeller fold protein YncE
MRTRLTWILAILALVTISVLMACSTKYSSSSNGLLIVPNQEAMESFSLDLTNGHPSEINNTNGPPINGEPQGVVIDPAGAFAYVIVYGNPAVNNSETGIESFPIASDGKLAVGTTTTLNPSGITPVQPVALAIDTAGKFLFVADSATNGVAGAVSVFAVSSGALTEVAGSPFPLATNPGATTPSASALAVTPTSYPTLYAPCSAFTPPTTEHLYVTDSLNYVLLNYLVSSSGALSIVTTSTTVGVPTGPVPDGVAVDPCNRYVYVSNSQSSGLGANSVSGFSICSAVTSVGSDGQPPCLSANYEVFPVKNSPFSISPGNNPGPLAVDAYGNYLYVVNVGSSTISSFRISPSTGSLAPLTPAFVVTGGGANSIAIRSDDSWMFVANGNGNLQTVSEFGITPSTGELVAQPAISTFNYPSGVAVK